MITSFTKITLTALLVLGSAVAVEFAAAEPTIHNGGKFNDKEEADILAKANELAEQGRKSLRLYRASNPGKPSDLVDAAIAFDQAQELYRKINDQDNLSESQSSFYWCKKEMNLETMNLYLTTAHKGTPLKDLPRDEPTPATAPVTPNPPVATVPADEKALTSAHAFAKAHADDVSGVAKSYAEVASKFPGTKSAAEAQALANEFQAKYDAWIKAGGNLPQTRFTKISAEKFNPKLTLPDSKIVNESITDLKKVFAKEYAKKSSDQKVYLAEKLIAEADRTKDSNLRYVDLIEAVRMAQEGENYLLMLDTIDNIARQYLSFDAPAEKKKWLQRAAGRPGSGAILTLLDTPRDEAANVTAGRYICYQLNRWQDGLPLLVIGNDADLKELAGLELKSGANDKHGVEIADGWFDIAKKTSSSNDKYGILEHARFFYKRARGLDTVTQARVAKRLEEIEEILPLDLDSLDFNKLTLSQWKRLPGTVTIAPIRVARTGLGQLRPGQKARVVPLPEDTAAYGTFRVALDSGSRQAPGIVNGPGTLWAFPADIRDERGSVRIKLVTLESE